MSFKTTNSILLFFISVLFIFQVASVNAVNYTEYPCDHIQGVDCTTQNIIIEKQDKQIADLNKTVANLTNTIIEKQNTEDTSIFWKNVGTGFGIIGSIIGIIGGIYGIKKKREVSDSQLKTEATKRSAYRATKKAKDAEKNKHNIDSGKKLWDWFRGK